MTNFVAPIERSMLAKAGWATLAALVLVAPASAQQRDPAYAAARASGQVGEKVDGYLGFPVAPSAEIRRLADDINIKRKAVYAERAEANGATIEEYAFSAGCQAIARSVPGEKYQAPDGSWQTRTAAAPLRDPRCP
ncbi:MAG: YdbL family protein [Novosphingobium sp.]|uniref:YdbL family protein n=1 Tax=Novosphingobium sp. TaxID=1874826 RepID=UPI003919EE5B